MQAKDTFGMWERQSCTRSRGRTARVHGPRGFAARAVDAAVLPSSLCRIAYFSSGCNRLLAGALDRRRRVHRQIMHKEEGAAGPQRPRHERLRRVYTYMCMLRFFLRSYIIIMYMHRSWPARLLEAACRLRNDHVHAAVERSQEVLVHSIMHMHRKIDSGCSDDCHAFASCVSRLSYQTDAR